MKLSSIYERYPDTVFQVAIGFDRAIMGVDQDMRLVCSVSKCIDLLIKKYNMTYEQAQEYFDFNVSGAYVGEETPVWCDDFKE